MGSAIKALKKTIKLIEDEEERSVVRGLLRGTLGQYLQMQSSYQCAHCNFKLAYDYLRFSIESLTKALPESMDTDSLEECRTIIIEEMVSLEKLRSVIESELEKEEDDK